MNIIKTQYFDITYSIIKSKRKTLSIIIEDNGNVIVRAPKFLSDYEIKKFVFDKSDWIISKLLNIKTIEEKKYIDGEKFLYLGKNYKLITIEGNYDVGILNDYIYISLKKDFFKNIELKKEMILKWYKKEAKRIIFERLEYYSKIMNLKYGKVYIRDQKTRWGSCSGKNNLSFNFRIIMAPIRKLDYIIIHELAHIVYKNHKKEFWNYVAKYCDDYLESRKWFRENGYKLSL
ncbi:M48 family metallopeptidase [Marinitoga litoralis]|uniref:M48 family metallopeptidase n=1 Tax=Marinitoga litoralis TaxID=570855 RepID=UPI00196009E7|nr:SprT family zinc-dependent metalloprotease [Marinitoga litoralis]MBM7559715.1 putative metal-dependent hydrolase [Marinitoga litoralis]